MAPDSKRRLKVMGAMGIAAIISAVSIGCGGGGTGDEGSVDLVASKKALQENSAKFSGAASRFGGGGGGGMGTTPEGPEAKTRKKGGRGGVN